MSARVSGTWAVKPGVCKHDHPETSADVVGPNGEFVADCGCADNAKAHAEFIVRACNSHDALLLVLKRAADLLDCWSAGDRSGLTDCSPEDLCPACLVHAEAEAAIASASEPESVTEETR